MANGLPLDLTLGVGKLDKSLPDLAPGTRLPVDTGVSTGRAADIAPTSPQQGGGVDVGSLLNYEPTTRDRVGAFLLGLGSNDPGASAKALNALTESKRKAGMEVLKYQLDFMKFLREDSAKSMTAFNTFLGGLKTLGESSLAGDSDQMELAIKGLERGAEEGGIPWAKTLVRPMLARPDVATIFPDLVRFIRQPAAQVIGLRLPQLLKEGKAETALWAAAAPEIQAQVDQRVGQVVAALKARPEFKDGPIPFDLVADLAAQGNRVLGDYLYNRLPKDVADTIGPARQSFLNRLAAQGVALPSTAAKAAEAEATAGATKRAGLAPDIVAGEAAAAAEKKGAEKRAELAPDIVAGEVAAKAAEQKALLPGRIEVARQQGAAAEEVKETIRRGRSIPADAAALIGLPKGTTVGQAEDQGVKIPDVKELAGLKTLKNFVTEGLDTIRTLDSLIAQAPTTIGTSGRIVTLLTGLRAQTENFARLSGVTVDASLHPRDYAGTFRELGITGARIQGQVIALAFPLAVAAQGGGGRLSDKDVEFQIRRIGAQTQDPVAFRAVLADVEQSLASSFERAIATATGVTPLNPRARPGRSAAGKPPPSADIERMSLAELRRLPLQSLDADQRKALDRALRRLGF